MNITILCNRDLASCIALNHLLPALSAHHVTVFTSSSVGRAATTPVPELQCLKFYEQELFNTIIWPLLDVSHQHVSNRLHSFTGLANMIGQPVTALNNINQPDGLARLKQTEPALIVSIRYGVILREQALAVPSLGVLNLHSGRLPDYKGVMATFRALLNGDTRLGTTLHWIDDSSIDTGRIIEVTSQPVVAGKSYLWHVLALYEEGCRSIAGAVASLARGETLHSDKQTGAGHYYTFPTASDFAAFRHAGWKLVDSAELSVIAKQFMG